MKFLKKDGLHVKYNAKKTMANYSLICLRT